MRHVVLQAKLHECGGPAAVLAAVEHNLAGLAHARGANDNGEGHIERALALRPPDDADGQLADRGVLAALWTGQGRVAEAEALFAELAAAWAARYHDNHYEAALCRRHLAVLAERRGDTFTAARFYRSALAATIGSRGSGHPEVADLQKALAAVDAAGTRASHRP